MKALIVVLQIILIIMVGYSNDMSEIRHRNLTRRDDEILKLLNKVELNTINQYQLEVKIDYLNARLNACELTHTGR